MKIEQQPGKAARTWRAIRACREHELGDPRIVVVGGYSGDGALEATRTILKARRLPQAIFFMNDEMALAGQEVLWREGAAGDLAVAGYDDIPEAAARGLTTIQAPVGDIAALAIELLERRIGSPDRAFQSVKLRPRLIVRNSTSA